ncbi:MAG: lipopolysaccharide biosynthesis protein [Rhizobiales bacterium]|nr:lipopolysaccharide biosynthesis protein [Hyphomicrobiales bacterium]
MQVGVHGGGFVPANGDVSLASLGRGLWRRKRLIFGSAIVVAVLSFIVVNLITPKYRSEARLLIEGRENVFLRPEAEKNVERQVVDLEAVASQVQILTSRDLASKVIKDLKLTEQAEFDPVLRGVSIPTVVLAMLGFAKDPLSMTPEERVLQAYFDRLTVLPIDKTRVITVEFTSSDPKLAARVTNAIVDAYFKFQTDAKQEQTRGAGQWLAVEIEKLRAKVTEAESNVENFRAKSDLYGGANTGGLVGQQLVDLNNQLALARSQKADLDAKSRLIRDMLKSGRPVESSDISNSELLRRLVEQRVTLRAQLAEQSSTLLDAHPRIKELKAQINALDTQLHSELEKLVRSIENDARIAGARIETTSVSIGRLKKQIAGSSGQEIELRGLEREAKAQRDLLESYLAKYREATARDSLDATPAEARIISRATISNVPYFPKKMPIVSLATLGTIFLMGAFIATGIFLGGGETSSAPVPRSARSIRARSLFDALRGRKRTPTATAPMPAAATAATMPIEELAQALRRLGEAGRRITVIGSARNAGTTYTAIGLSRELAKGAGVVLVDLALGAPNLAIISTDPNAPGICDLLRGTASYGDIITRDRFSPVHLIATGRVGAEGQVLLGSPRLAITLEALTRTYDHVVIDAGAVPEVAVESFARLAPRAVLVATNLADPSTDVARQRLIAAGFNDVTVFLGKPRGPNMVPAAA